jgi:hypothetical protein
MPKKEVETQYRIIIEQEELRQIIISAGYEVPDDANFYLTTGYTRPDLWISWKRSQPEIDLQDSIPADYNEQEN